MQLQDQRPGIVDAQSAAIMRAQQKEIARLIDVTAGQAQKIEELYRLVGALEERMSATVQRKQKKETL